MNTPAINIEGIPADKSAPSLRDSYWLAERLGIGYDTARALGRDRKVPVVKIGRLLRYSPAAIEKWICDQMEAAK